MYKPGWIGTWIMWFINQHSTFPQYEIVTNNGDREDDSFPTDYICKGGSWFWGDGQSFTDSSTNQTERNRVINKSVTNRCYKTFPDHHFTDEQENVQDFIDSIDFDYNVIIANVTNARHLEILARRFTDIIELDEDEDAPRYESVLAENINDSNRINIEKNYYTKIEHKANSIYYVDVGKILFDKDNTEYSKLLDYINEKPIDNWEKMADEAIEIVFKRYMNV